MTSTRSRRDLIFGGAGFIGQHLSRELVAGGSEVVIADIVEPQSLPDGAKFQYCDVRETISVDTRFGFDAVYNLAAVHRTPGHKPHEYYETNVGGAVNIVDWLTPQPTQRLFFTSSIAVYGQSEDLKSETSAPQPNSDYGRSKLMAEDIFRQWANGGFDRSLVITRPAVVFGSGEGGNFTRLAAALRRGTFAYPGRKDTVKSCGYVTDLVAALAFAESLPDKYFLFNFCYEHRSSIEEICGAFNEVAGYRSPKTLPPRLVNGALVLLERIPFANQSAFSPSRIAKLTASTNIAPDALVQRGFTWPTTLESALESWKAEAPNGVFI